VALDNAPSFAFALNKKDTAGPGPPQLASAPLDKHQVQELQHQQHQQQSHSGEPGRPAGLLTSASAGQQTFTSVLPSPGPVSPNPSAPGRGKPRKNISANSRFSHGAASTRTTQSVYSDLPDPEIVSSSSYGGASEDTSSCMDHGDTASEQLPRMGAYNDRRLPNRHASMSALGHSAMHSPPQARHSSVSAVTVRAASQPHSSYQEPHDVAASLGTSTASNIQSSTLLTMTSVSGGGNFPPVSQSTGGSTGLLSMGGAYVPAVGSTVVGGSASQGGAGSKPQQGQQQQVPISAADAGAGSNASANARRPVKQNPSRLSLTAGPSSRPSIDVRQSIDVRPSSDGDMTWGPSSLRTLSQSNSITAVQSIHKTMELMLQDTDLVRKVGYQINVGGRWVLVCAC
jgi:hypothetical protein